jgi:hypothetical protein
MIVFDCGSYTALSILDLHGRVVLDFQFVVQLFSFYSFWFGLWLIHCQIAPGKG